LTGLPSLFLSKADERINILLGLSQRIPSLGHWAVFVDFGPENTRFLSWYIPSQIKIEIGIMTINQWIWGYPIFR
jgi:hypothetical protein